MQDSRGNPQLSSPEAHLPERALSQFVLGHFNKSPAKKVLKIDLSLVQG